PPKLSVKVDVEISGAGRRANRQTVTNVLHGRLQRCSPAGSCSAQFRCRTSARTPRGSSLAIYRPARSTSASRNAPNCPAAAFHFYCSQHFNAELSVVFKRHIVLGKVHVLERLSLIPP